MDNLIFEPWIGPNCYKNPLGKLLIVGESHYIGDEEDYGESTGFTTKIVEGYINKEWDIAFFPNTGLLFNESDRYKIWKDVAFANAMQPGLSSSKSQPEKKHSNHNSCFWVIAGKTES